MILGFTFPSLQNALFVIIVIFSMWVYILGRFAASHPGKALKIGRFLWFYLRK